MCALKSFACFHHPPPLSVAALPTHTHSLHIASQSISQPPCFFLQRRRTAPHRVRRLAFFIPIRSSTPPSFLPPCHDRLTTHQPPHLYLYALCPIASHPAFRTTCSHHHRITSTTYPTRICAGGHPFPFSFAYPCHRLPAYHSGPGLHLRWFTPGHVPAGHPVTSAGVGRGPRPRRQVQPVCLVRKNLVHLVLVLPIAFVHLLL